MDGNIAHLAAGLGVGFGLIGVSLGIGKLAAAGMDGIARQPAAAGELRTSMLLVATFIEGVGMLGMVVCILLAAK